MSIRVFIIAPTLTLRAGLRALLAQADITIVGEAAAFPVALPVCDVLLLANAALLPDTVQVPGSLGEVALVLLADDPRLALRLRRMPLRGWALVSPDASESELHAAVLAATQGMVALPQALAVSLLSQAPTPESLDDTLTPREREVLELIGQGLPNKLIALQLNISEHTVKFHISSIFAKLGAASRTEAVSLGARRGLIAL
ncbi:MAG: response regulator transcription factor [Chloroflexaceae bacterium]|jgi:DNA-binding NarL/FixJ family response regulator|nr:response regulator transcription factor [Chloroflexaceae bacterium]